MAVGCKNVVLRLSWAIFILKVFTSGSAVAVLPMQVFAPWRPVLDIYRWGGREGWYWQHQSLTELHFPEEGFGKGGRFIKSHKNVAAHTMCFPVHGVYKTPT